MSFHKNHPLTEHAAPGVTDARETWRDRAELVRIAARRAGETHAGISAHFHVGAHLGT